MSVEKLNDDTEIVDRICCFGNTLNASGGSEITSEARTRI